MEDAGTKILIIEDDPDQSLLLERQVTGMGYTVRLCNDGAAASGVVTEWRPDLILMDLHLPGITGIEVTERLRKSHAGKKTPIIMMSGSFEEARVVEAFEKGVDEYINKPLRMKELAIRITSMLRLKRNEQQLEKEKSILTRYFSEDFVEQVLQEKIDANLGGTKLTASIMFFDLRYSTRVGEELDPHDFSEFMNNILTDVMDLVFGNKGSVNKMLGDGLMATFGCPVPGEKDTWNAVKCALDIREYLRTYNEVRPDYLKDPVRAGIGIATGKIFAGNIGSVRRMEYTVMGDSVNTAARLEALTKKAGKDIFIDGPTRDALQDFLRVRPVKVQSGIRGKLQEVRVFYLDSMVMG